MTSFHEGAISFARGLYTRCFTNITERKGILTEYVSLKERLSKNWVMPINMR